MRLLRRHLAMALAALVVVVACGPVSGAASVRDAVTPPVGSPAPAPSPSAKITVYTYITGKNAMNPAATVAAIDASPNAAYVRGLSWVFPWSAIEPAQGQFNWTPIDDAVAASGSRKVMLRIIAGRGDPAWVTSSVPSVTENYSSANGPATATLAIPWDPGFEADWTRFIAAYGARYADDSRISVVQMPGGGVLGESSLGDWSGWLSTAPPPNGCGSEPYTNAAMLAAWQQFVGAYLAAFPHTQLALDDDGPAIHGAYTVQQPLAQWVEPQYGQRVWFQGNGLGHSGSGIFNFLTALESSTSIGWQEWLGGQGADFQMTAAQTAVASHAAYVEWYLADVLSADGTAALRLMTF